MTIQLNNEEIAWHESQLSIGTRILDTTVQLAPIITGLGSAAISYKTSTSATVKGVVNPSSTTKKSMPTVDAEMANRNKSSNSFKYSGISQQYTKYYHHTEYNNKSAISDGVFVTDPIGMERHKPITAPKGKSVFKSDVDAEKLALDAARYATNHNLWKDGKAKVYVNNIVGYVNGNPTKVINIYKGKPNKDGLSPIHASPGTER